MASPDIEGLSHDTDGDSSILRIHGLGLLL